MPFAAFPFSRLPRLSAVHASLFLGLAASAAGCGSMDNTAQPLELPSEGEFTGQDAAPNNQDSLPAGNDGQPGGQSGGSSGAAPGPQCYCGFSELAKARVVDVGVDGECAVFELLEKPAGDPYYHELEVGDHFGGSAMSLCDDALTADANDVVYVRYWPGENAGTECAEFIACTQTECGSQPVESDDAQADLEAFEAWASCNGACVENTRHACAAHEEQARYSGKVTVAARDDDGNVIVVIDGTPYAVAPAQLADPSCSPSGVPQSVTSPTAPADGETGAGAPPPAALPASNASCNIPD